MDFRKDIASFLATVALCNCESSMCALRIVNRAHALEIAARFSASYYRVCVCVCVCVCV